MTFWKGSGEKTALRISRVGLEPLEEAQHIPAEPVMTSDPQTWVWVPIPEGRDCEGTKMNTRVWGEVQP